MEKKPLTPNDLIVGNKYVVCREPKSIVAMATAARIRNTLNPFLIYLKQENGYSVFNHSDTDIYFSPKELIELTPYHEPNQTTINTDYTEQPFNLETALKHPEWVYFRNGEKPLEWHWFEKLKSKWSVHCVDLTGERIVCTTEGKEHHSDISKNDLILRVPYREVWVNVYPNNFHETKEQADYNAAGSRLACVPIKIPAI